ncbi:Hypothetical predicted protein [Mytilus galloprovincialis]|uniref:Uncharacterized protein n=1 Tax=Mytilus galloprovincialis TaxID=29158 RepID=A0A8B6GSY1_MYTGA|nr:Hypothetical predicted protein [Mytilus galloprovincialis]
MKLRPSEIYFTQASISSNFGRCTRHANTTIGETLDDLAEGRINIGSIPNISVMKENGKWWTADNRRLWIFRHLEKLRKCTEISVYITYSIDSRKRSSTNGGTDVHILKGKNPGGVWHSKVDSIKIQDTSDQKDMNKDIFTVPVVRSHSNNHIECITDCISSDNKKLECNDQHIKPVETIKGSPCATFKPDSTSIILKSESEKTKHYLNMKPLKSVDQGMEINAIPLENLHFPVVQQNSNIPSISYKPECIASNRFNSRNTSDFIHKRPSLHQMLRYAPYNHESKILRLGNFEQALASKPKLDTNTNNMFMNSIYSYFSQIFSKIFQFGNHDDRYVDTSIYQQSKYYYVHPKKNVHSYYSKINGQNYDSGSDLEDEYDYCDECESDTSNDNQSLGESSDDSDEESSDDSDKENSEDSHDDKFYYSDDEYLELSDNDRLRYSQKKNSSNAFLLESHHSTTEFQHSCRESSDIVYDSFHNAVDEFRCYDYLSKELDDEDSCGSVSNAGDYYTAVLDRACIDGCYNSDVDNMIYDYID